MTRNWRPVIVLLGVVFTIAHCFGTVFSLYAVMLGAAGGSVGAWVWPLLVILGFPVLSLIAAMGGLVSLPTGVVLALVAVNSLLWGGGAVVVTEWLRGRRRRRDQLPRYVE
jgi:hypothetical protein